jgi:hypothetical protein
MLALTSVIPMGATGAGVRKALKIHLEELVATYFSYIFITSFMLYSSTHSKAFSSTQTNGATTPPLEMPANLHTRC